MQFILATTIFSCKSSSDNFIGKWVACNHPEYSCTITKNGGGYILHPNGAPGAPDFVLEKKADEILAIVGDQKRGVRPGAIRYDKLTNHLMMTEVIDKEERTQEFCKSE